MGNDLLVKVSEGDEEAFALFVKQYWKNMYSQALSYLKSAQVAEELTQDVFMKVWNARQELANIKNVEGYIYVICRNAVLNELRKMLRLTMIPNADAVEDILRPDKQLEFREYQEQLLALIEKLPEKRKEVFKMSRLEGKSHEEIAAVLGIHKDTVAQYIVKAVNFLRTELMSRQADILLVCLLLGTTG